MVVVGFDVGKDTLFGARLDRSGVVKEHWELANTQAVLLPVLRGLRRKYKHLLVASEVTAEYHRPLAQLCLTLNIPFSLINPITTKQFTRATVRKRKTDKGDAEVIARVAMQDQSTLVTKDTFNDVKPMLRTSVKLIQMSRMLTLMQYHMADVLPNEPALLQQLATCQEALDVAAATFRSTTRQRESIRASVSCCKPYLALAHRRLRCSLQNWVTLPVSRMLILLWLTWALTHESSRAVLVSNETPISPNVAHHI